MTKRLSQPLARSALSEVQEHQSRAVPNRTLGKGAPQFGSEYWKAWVHKKTPPAIEDNGPDFRIVDLFCGCGGMTLGALEAARLAGYKCSIALAADVFAEAALVYQDNFSALLECFISDDISEIFPADGIATGAARHLRQRFGPIDLLVAGPPCQGHSNLNNSTRRDDPRNQLYLSAITAIEVLKPTICIVENVPAVIHDKSGVTQNSLARLISAGYHVEELVLRMDRIGLPQRRKRHLLIAHRSRAPYLSDLIEHAYVQSSPPLKDFIGDLTEEWKKNAAVFRTPSKMTSDNTERVKVLFDTDLYDLPDAARPPCHSEKSHSYKSAYGRLSWDRPAQTITSGFGSMGQGRYVHPSQPRTITPHEAARIQGFPDFFSFETLVKRTALQKIIANAVPPPAMATIVRALLGDVR